MRSIILLLLMCFPVTAQEPPTPELSLALTAEKYEVKDNIFIKVMNADDNLRVKIMTPSLERITPIQLHETGSFFFQAKNKGKYIVEASDSDEDAFEIVNVVSELPPDAIVPDSRYGKDIFEELLKVKYSSVHEDSEAIAAIFEKNIGKEPAQKLINETFSEIQAYLKDNPNKDEWKIFFVFLQAYFEGLDLKASDIDSHNTLWKDTQEAFVCRSKND